jgi:hypothetical protein
MDRNLGAAEAALSLAGWGLIYQWGRKDPMPGTTAGTAGYAALNKFSGMPDAGNTAIVRVSGTTNAAAIAESIRKPATYLSDVDSGDWLPFRDNELWGHSGGKTVYDPCPEGWRVPVSSSGLSATSSWYGLPSQVFTAGNSGGIDWGTNALWPAAGFRNNNEGSANKGGSEGNYWSASPYNGNENISPETTAGNCASGMTFIPDGRLFIDNFRSNSGDGFSVRCVRE